MKFESILHSPKFTLILIVFVLPSKSIEGYRGSESPNYFNNEYIKRRDNYDIIELNKSFPLTKNMDKFVSKKQSGSICSYT